MEKGRKNEWEIVINVTFVLLKANWPKGAHTPSTSIDYLDLTVFKGKQFTKNKLLDIKTYQKLNNLYQYLHFISNHPKSTYKSIITGECIRYARTNTDETNYIHQVSLFKTRLQHRGYPSKLIEKHTSKVKFSNRQSFLQPIPKVRFSVLRPIFKCLPPPQYKQLKTIILHRFQNIKNT